MVLLYGGLIIVPDIDLKKKSVLHLIACLCNFKNIKTNTIYIYIFLLIIMCCIVLYQKEVIWQKKNIAYVIYIHEVDLIHALRAR